MRVLKDERGIRLGRMEDEAREAGQEWAPGKYDFALFTAVLERAEESKLQ